MQKCIFRVYFVPEKYVFRMCFESPFMRMTLTSILKYKCPPPPSHHGVRSGIWTHTSMSSLWCQKWNLNPYLNDVTMVLEVGFEPIPQCSNHGDRGRIPAHISTVQSPWSGMRTHTSVFSPDVRNDLNHRNLNVVIMVRVRSGIQTLDLNEITNTMMSKVGYQPKPQCSHHAWCQQHNMNPYLCSHHGARSGIWMSIDDMFLSITWDHKSRCFVFILRTDSNYKCTTLYKATPCMKNGKVEFFLSRKK